MAETDEVTVTMALQDGYRFLVDLQQEGVAGLLLDEPEPLGGGRGPNAARVLAAAVGNCLSASALFCLRKARVDVRGMRTTVDASLVRTGRGRLRVGAIGVRIRPTVAAADLGRIGRCLALFEDYEDYCVVTQSVRDGLDVAVRVEPAVAPGSAPMGDDRPAAAPGGTRGAGVVGALAAGRVRHRRGLGPVPSIGAVVLVAVVSHDFADGMNTIAFVLAQGSPVRPARRWLLVDALAPEVGALLGAAVPLSTHAYGLGLAAYAGIVLAIGVGAALRA
jgi:organic hydroperoxide reductase OsmC/OhrA